jgi:hypothetical protein
MALIPGLTVAAPEPLRRRYGLFDAASGPIDLAAHGEGGGVRYVPFTCGQAYAYGVTCYTVEDPAPAKPLDSDNAEVETGVFAVLSVLNCGAVGYTQAEYAAKARRRLEVSEQAAVEAALWTGEDFQGNALGILNLDDEAVAITGGYDAGLITDVVGALERYAYVDQGYGSVAYLHAPVEVAAFAAEAGLIIPEGTGPNVRKLTPMGSVWAFGAYPAGEIIVSGQTTVWRSPEIQTYSSFENASNELLVIAERAYSVSFDCFAGRAEFNPLEAS